MKLRHYSFIILFIIVGLSLMSNSNGRGFLFGAALTNAPGESGATCGQAGCHVGGNFGTGFNLFLTDSDGNNLSTYEPGVSYNLHVNITSSQGTPSRYGFQLVALDQSDNPINNWGDIETPYRKFSLGDREYVEQRQSLTSPNIVLPWVAPTAGTGSVSFYSTVNNCNGNGSPSGDHAFTSSVIIEEGAPSSTAEVNESIFSFYPNPVTRGIHLKNYYEKQTIQISDSNGTVIKQFSEPVNEINLEYLFPGAYLIQVFDERGQLVKSDRFIKI